MACVCSTVIINAAGTCASPVASYNVPSKELAGGSGAWEVEIASAFRDRTLAKRMRAGDEKAFREFFDLFFTPLFRFALVRLEGNPRDAEEIAQTTLCQGITKLETYRGEAGLLTWLCTICRREISGLYRQRSRVPPLDSEESPEIRSALQSLAAPAGDDPENSVLREELAATVEATLQSLPQHYADVLRWKYMDGLSVREIAERSGTRLKATESILMRARNAFREAFPCTSPERQQAVSALPEPS